MGLLSGSRPVDTLGVADGRLKPVREHYWNAVSSFAQTDTHRIAPLAGGADPRATFAALLELLRRRADVTIVTSEDLYVHAEFRTRWLGFVDDVEFLLDAPAGVIHVRSASRLGRKDFGVNRARVEALREALRARSGAPASGPTGTEPSFTASGTASAAVPHSTTQRTPMSTTLPSGLQIEDVVVGSGDEATAGRNVKVHYTGWLYKDGTAGAKFDSSKDRGQPFVFPLGAGHVIRGWDEGVAGMKVGGTRKLIIPPELGYGARGAGGVIPGNATLLFEVELLGV